MSASAPGRPKVEYTQSLLPGTGWVPSCSLCGALVLNPETHTEWHFPTPRCAHDGCDRTDGLKMCGPLGERCPEHFREP